MAKKPSKPSRIVIGAESYACVVLRVEERREDGRPDVLTIVYPDDVAELSKIKPEQNCFLTGFLHAGSLKPE